MESISANMQTEYISELKILRILDSLRPTATGLDGLPACSLKVGANYFSNQSRHCSICLYSKLATSTVPQQWQHAIIRPEPKVNSPSQHADISSDINNTNPLQNHGENNSSYVSVSSFSHYTTNPKSFWPVCFSAYRFFSRSYHINVKKNFFL